jgi:hypothetical protein
MAILSATEIYSDALKLNPKADLNTLHASAYTNMKKQHRIYYEEKVDAFLFNLQLTTQTKQLLRQQMLKPVMIDNTLYSNFMEEACRRLSQSTQTASGHVAELCVQKALTDNGLIKGINFTAKKDHTDITVWYPNLL